MAERTVWAVWPDRAVWADKCGAGGERRCEKQGIVVLLTRGGEGYETGNHRQDQEVHHVSAVANNTRKLLNI